MITRKELETKLWGAADILRGSIDSSDYKGYIFGMLFLKRISDVFEEEAQKILAETGDRTLAYDEPDEHSFYVPEKARWEYLRRFSEDIGTQLNKACEEIENANPKKLEGILVSVDFNDERRLGNTKQRDNILSRLILHFSDLDLSNGNLSELDLLGRAYEYLIERFADDAGKKGGEFYTPHKVVELLTKLLEPGEGMRICDPTCGSGGMLIECARQVKEEGGNPRNLSLYGQEKNLGTWAIAQMNMLLHDIPDFDIRKGDVIRDPQLVERGELMLFDRVIANPPFSLDNWGHEAVAGGDPFHRFRFGVPPKSKGDFAFIQHMLATVNGRGRVGVVVPHGVLFRGAAEGRIRADIVKADLLEAVVGLPPNLFYGTTIPAAILIFNRAKPAEHQDRVLFIDASQEFQSGKNQNVLRDADIERIYAAYGAYADEDKYSRVVKLDELAANEYNLNIGRYIQTVEEEERVDVALEITKLQELKQQRDAAEAKMLSFFKELGYDA